MDNKKNSNYALCSSINTFLGLLPEKETLAKIYTPSKRLFQK